MGSTRLRITGPSILTVLVALAVPSSLPADVIVLKNGNRFEGKILEETPQKVVLQMTYGTMDFKRSQIQEVQKKEGYTVPPPPPEEKPTPAEPKPEPAAPARPERSDPRGQKEAPATPTRKGPPPPTATEADLQALPQSPRITLEAVDRPVNEVLYKIARQSNCEIEWNESGEKKTISLSLKDAFFWDALMAVCAQGGWGFTIYSQPGNPIGIPGSFDAPPPRGHQTVGPVLLVWFGLAKESTFDFSVTPAKPVEVTQLALDLKIDRQSGVQIKEPVLNPDFVFTPQGGQRVTLKADKEAQDGMGGRTWRFQPGALKGESADLDVTIPVWAPGSRKEARVPWRSGATTKVGKVTVTLENAAAQPDKKLHVAYKLTYDPSTLSQVADEDTAAQYVLSITQIAVVGKDGKTLRSDSTGSGMGSPWTGYSYGTDFDAPAGFEPAEFLVTWAEGYRRADLAFKLKGIPLSAKATAEYTARRVSGTSGVPSPRRAPPIPSEPVRVTVRPTPKPGPGFGMVERGTIKSKEFAQEGAKSLTFSPDGKLLAVAGGKDPCLKIWDLSDLEREKTALFGFQQSVRAAVFCPDGRRLAAGGWEGFIIVFDVQTERDLATLKGHQMSILSLAVSPDGKRLASGSLDGKLKLWDLTTYKEIAGGDSEGGSSVCFSPDGSQIASVSSGADAAVRRWDGITGKSIGVLRSDSAAPTCVCFSPDGKRLAVAVGPRIRLHDLTGRTEVVVLEDYRGEDRQWTAVTSLAFTPDGAVLASGSERKTVKLWDMNTRQELLTLEGHEGRVTSVAFSPDNRLLASGDSDFTIKLWQWKQ